MGEECEGKNLFDFPFPHENGGGHSEHNATQDILRENEEESSGASDYPEGISGFTPPKDFRIHKLVKAKTDRKTTKKPMHRSHSASKLSKKEPRPTKSKSMIELPLLSPDVNVSHQKQRHFSIPPATTATTSGFKDTMENTLLNKNNEKEKPVMQHESQSFPVVSESKERTESINVESQIPAQSCMKSSISSVKKDLPDNTCTFHVEPHNTSNPWQKFPFRRRSSVDANTLSLNSMVSRTSSSPTNSSLRLFDSLHDLRRKPRTSLNLLSVHVDQDDRLDYGIPTRMKSSSLSQHGHTSSFIPECPRERNEFYSHLHMTVLHLGIAGAVARRHADAEETYLTKENIHQSISMQLRAYLQNRSVKVVSDDLAMRKLDVGQAINDIMDFVLPLECEMTHKGLFRPFSVRSLYTEISNDSSDGYGDDNKPLETISEEDSESQSTDDLLKKDKDVAFHDDQFMTSAQARAMERVKEVLGALDEAESLYQSLAEMGDEHPKYRCLQFMRRVEALHLWMRITEMLASKLCQMSRLCGLRVDLEPGEDDVCLQSLNSSRISWSVMEMEQTRTSCCEKKYRDFVDQHLKKYGLEKMMKFIKKSLANALLIARYAYTGERNVEFQLSHKAHFHRGSSSEGERVPLLKDSPAKARSMWERRNSLFPTFDEGWLSVFEQMNLPSFDRQFLQLARVPLDVMHICIRKNLILRFQDHLSILSLKALVKDCRQIIMEAIEVRNDYREAAMLVTGDDQMKQEQVTTEMETFEDDLQSLLKEYFNYVQRCNLLGEPGKQWNILQLEWDRVKSFCVNIKGGEAQAGRVFCAMVERQVQSVGDFFQNKVDNLVHQMHSCRLEEQIKQCLQRSCRNFKGLFVDMRERIVKTLGFAKLLRKDLEIAADFDVISNHNEILHNLLASDHVQVVLQHGCDGRLLFVPESIADNISEVIKLLSLNFGRNETTADTVERSRRYLVILEVDGIAALSSWPNDKINHIDTSVETAIAVMDLQVNGLKLIVQNFSDLQHNCDSFQKAMGVSVSIRNRQTSGHESVNESIAALTNSVITLSKDVLHFCEEAQDHLTHENEYVEDQNLYRDAVHSCFNLGFECCQEMIRLIGNQGTYKELGNAMVLFAKRWAKFVLDSCERGRGTRPRWATAGLDFLTIACHPLLLMELTNVEYEELAELIKKCLDHVVGDSSTSTSRQVSRLSSRRASDQWSRGYFRRRSSPSNLPIFPESGGHGKESPPVSHSSVESNSSGVGNDSPPVSTAVNLYPIFNSTTPVASRSFSHQDSSQSGSSDNSTLLSSYVSIPSISGSLEFDTTSKYKEIQASLAKLDAARDEKLRSNKIIGHVVEQTNHQGINRSVSVRHVNFRWQRGKKIGAGKFGTVYSCINMDTSELMAVKQIPFQESNHSDIERIYDEIRFVQNINHPNIVRVYGMERHHDELFLFMEFCGEGTIWDVAKQGLTIDMIRRYTYEITVGLDELHRQCIVHRDIKGANIFITADGSVKIGDFGLCVQIKHAKTRPEEIKGTAGTAAYMAPEVIHGGVEGRTIGRSADIWSLGCVIVEMATGKMPYCDLDNEYAIMFQVGNGIAPTVPNINDTLKAEGKDFLSCCFHPEPDQRWTASKLLEHSFVKWIHR